MHHHPTLVHTRDDKLGTWFGCQIQIKHWTRAIPVTLGLRLPHFSCRVYWLVQENLALQVSQQLQMDTLVWNLESLEAMRIKYRWCARRHTSLCIRVTGLEQVGHMPHFNAICVSWDRSSDTVWPLCCYKSSWNTTTETFFFFMLYQLLHKHSSNTHCKFLVGLST